MTTPRIYISRREKIASEYQCNRLQYYYNTVFENVNIFHIIYIVHFFISIDLGKLL